MVGLEPTNFRFPKAGTLTRLSYTPSSYIRANSMAVCTHELALGDLIPDGKPCASMHEGAHLEALRLARKMIPVHRCVVEATAAVRAGSRFLDLSMLS